MIRKLNKNINNNQNDASIKQKVIESVNAKLEQQKNQIKNRLQNLPIKVDKKVKRAESSNKNKLEIPDISSGIKKEMENLDVGVSIDEIDYVRRDESNLFDTKVDIARSYLNDNPSKSYAIQSDSKPERIMSKPLNNITTIHKVINSIDSFAFIEQKLKNGIYINNDSKIDANFSVSRNQSQKGPEPAIHPFENHIDSKMVHSKVEYVNSSIRNYPIIEIDEIDENDGLLDCNDDNMAVSLKNYLYDDMLGCYYDPVTKEYYAES